MAVPEDTTARADADAGDEREAFEAEVRATDDWFDFVRYNNLDYPEPGEYYQH